MRHKNYFISLLLLLAALTASAQTCPGPPNRTALINLQKSQIVNGTRWGQTVLTDTCGNQRYVTLDSMIVIIVDSIAADTTLQRNWYTHNGVTTDLGRFAYVKRTAWWLGLDSVGFLRHTMRPDLFRGTQSTLFQDSFVVEYTNDVAVRNYISLADTGVVISTTGDEPRSVNVRTDTINWSSSFDPAFQIHNLLADITYFKHSFVSGQLFIGEFDLLSRGFQIANGSFVSMDNEDGMGAVSRTRHQQNGEYEMISRDNSGISQINVSSRFVDGGAGLQIINEDGSPGKQIANFFERVINNDSLSIWTVKYQAKDAVGGGFNFGLVYLGENSSVSNDTDTLIYSGPQAFGVRTIDTVGTGIKTFDWLQTFLPSQDTTSDNLSFYNRAYYWRNEHPIGAAGDTLFHFWAATGPGGEAGKDPGFMTLDDIRGGGVNWYNSNGTTTDNTRIAAVTETATWLSDDVTVDGVFPFRFELAGGVPNEPEMMVWKFPTDSATLYQSDQELVLHSTNQWVFRSDEQTRIWADSFSYSNGSSGGFAVTQYNRITQSSVSNGDKQDLLENRTITGTAQTELFLDGSSAVLTLPANRNNNFEIHVSAICSDAGNGVGITTGDAYASWHVGGIKRVVNTTSLVGTVQTTATAQSDASMSTSVVTIDADDTDDSLRIRFTPPSTAGSTTVLRVLATIQLSQIGY